MYLKKAMRLLQRKTAVEVTLCKRRSMKSLGLALVGAKNPGARNKHGMVPQKVKWLKEGSVV